MADIKVDRKRIGDYIKQYAEVLAQNGDIYINTREVESMDGTVTYLATVEINLKDIPVEAVGA